MHTMFEPIPKPSFDTEARARYLAWLEQRYGADVHELNLRYGLSKATFGELSPDEYWLRPDELTGVGCALPTADDFARRSADFYRWVDNQSYLADELDQYLAAMLGH